MIIYGSGKGGRIHRNVQPSIAKEKVGPTRVCRLCGKEKPLTAYAKSAKLKLGRAYECKACVKERWRKNYGKGGNQQGTPCIVKDLETGEEARYSSTTKAAAVIGCHHSMVSDRLRGRVKRPIHGRYEVRQDDDHVY